MLPSFFTSQAEKLFLKRWWFLSVSIIGMGAIFFSNSGITKSILPVVLFIPFIVVPWGLLCMCVWFHPTQGKLYVGPLISKLPAVIQSAIRWYAAIFLVVFFAFGLLGFPIFGLVANG